MVFERIQKLREREFVNRTEHLPRTGEDGDGVLQSGVYGTIYASQSKVLSVFSGE